MKGSSVQRRPGSPAYGGAERAVSGEQRVRRHRYTGRGFSGASAVKNLPAMQEPQETWVRSLGQEEHPPEEGMATGFSTPAWRTPRTEESGELQSKGLQRAGPD